MGSDVDNIMALVTNRPYRDVYAAEYAPLLDGSVAMRAIRAMVETIADTDATVVLRGESGVGKDLVARAIHAASRRRNGPFIKVYCAAIPCVSPESETCGSWRTSSAEWWCWTRESRRLPTSSRAAARWGHPHCAPVRSARKA